MQLVGGGLDPYPEPQARRLFAQPDAVVVVAADEPEVVDSMLERARGGADVVAGSRYMRGGRQFGRPFLKSTLSSLAGLSLHWVGGMPIQDPNRTFKLSRRLLLDQLTIESVAGL